MHTRHVGVTAWLGCGGTCPSCPTVPTPMLTTFVWLTTAPDCSNIMIILLKPVLAAVISAVSPCNDSSYYSLIFLSSAVHLSYFLAYHSASRGKTRDGSVSSLSVGSHFSASSLDLHELIVLVLLSSSRVHSAVQQSMQHQYIL